MSEVLCFHVFGMDDGLTDEIHVCGCMWCLHASNDHQGTNRKNSTLKGNIYMGKDEDLSSFYCPSSYIVSDPELE